MEADFQGGFRVAAERHRLAIHHAVLLTPVAMRFSNVDLKRGKCITPLADLMADDAKSLHVLRLTAVLRNVYAKAIVDQDLQETRMSIKEEAVRDKQALGSRK